ncbi:hypothetical protein SAMN04487996_13439 [Dyadobacter soli]|uniref:Uncharacterized protein n=1 Tax=Dyadobacter soli TaxID=659014 RepID=A0A1G8BU37_9BACT|nr:hypothetical protein SAMN04487996_13439 [Dyadobacter soli]
MTHVFQSDKICIASISCPTDYFTSESVILARSFIEKVTNFCYASLFDSEEYRAFVLHPLFKRYDIMSMPTMQDSLDSWPNHVKRERSGRKLLKRCLLPGKH